jgi:hypothetical protein
MIVKILPGIKDGLSAQDPARKKYALNQLAQDMFVGQVSLLDALRIPGRQSNHYIRRRSQAAPVFSKCNGA